MVPERNVEPALIEVNQDKKLEKGDSESDMRQVPVSPSAVPVPASPVPSSASPSLSIQLPPPGSSFDEKCEPSQAPRIDTQD